MGYWDELKSALGDFSKLAAEELKYQAGQLGKAAVKAGKDAATTVWENREAIAESLIARAHELAEEERRRQEQMPQTAPRQSHVDELGDFDEPTHVMDWQTLPNGLASDLSEFRDKVGLYRMRNEAGEVVYVGRAVEWDNGGLRKRLRDYTRESDADANTSLGK